MTNFTLWSQGFAAGFPERQLGQAVADPSLAFLYHVYRDQTMQHSTALFAKEQLAHLGVNAHVFPGAAVGYSLVIPDKAEQKSLEAMITEQHWSQPFVQAAIQKYSCLDAVHFAWKQAKAALKGDVLHRKLMAYPVMKSHVSGVSVREEADQSIQYILHVSCLFSRKTLARVGVTGVDTLRREGKKTDAVHKIYIPENQLPQGLRDGVGTVPVQAVVAQQQQGLPQPTRGQIDMQTHWQHARHG